MVTKPEFMKALGKLPADATIQDAIDRLYVLYKIEQGSADLEAGRVLSESELTERVKQWRK
jgi:predicted transcriptional regulator